MKQTPVHDRHVEMGAKMQEFAGYDMPIRYAGISAETLAVRQNCGIFDVSHMGEIRVSGEAAEPFLNWVFSRPIDGKRETIVSYVALCFAGNGTVDDMLVYRFAPQHDYWLVVNAANKDKDYKHLLDCRKTFFEQFPDRGQDLKIEDESELYGQVAVQGPKSQEYMRKFLEGRDFAAADAEKILTLKNYRQYRTVNAAGVSFVVSRTGYTGEDGFEIYCPADEILGIWDEFIALGVTPCGLGARDCLRLEAGMPLYGNEMSAVLNPLDAGMDFIVKKHEPFIAGKLRQTKKFIPIVSVKKAIARPGYPVKVDGKEVGTISSGSFSPTLKKGIAYAMVDVDFPADVENFEVEIHHKDRPFKKTGLPFFKAQQ